WKTRFAGYIRASCVGSSIARHSMSLSVTLEIPLCGLYSRLLRRQLNCKALHVSFCHIGKPALRVKWCLLCRQLNCKAFHVSFCHIVKPALRVIQNFLYFLNSCSIPSRFQTGKREIKERCLL